MGGSVLLTLPNLRVTLAIWQKRVLRLTRKKIGLLVQENKRTVALSIYCHTMYGS
jgi:hypothetical protein